MCLATWQVTESRITKDIDMALQHGYERNNRLNLPFDFEEAVMSQKEQIRIQKVAFTSNLFVTNSGILTVEEFQVRELSARVRTINNARDSMAVLPDGTPLTEVTMYGRRGEVYLLGPLKAVKTVMSGELPSSKRILQGVDVARKHIEKSLSQLTQSLHCLYSNKTTTVILAKNTRTEIRFGHGVIIDESMRTLLDLLAVLQSLEDEIRAWEKWWAPWSAQAGLISARIADVLVKHDEAKERLMRILEQASQPSTGGAFSILQGAPFLIDEIRYSFNVISKEALELQNLLDRLVIVERIQNIEVAGSLTQLWLSDVPYIETALKSFVGFSAELLQLEQNVIAMMTTAEQQGDQLDVFLNRKSAIMSQFKDALSNLVKQVIGSPAPKTKAA